MKLQQNQRTIQRSGNFKETGFRIAANAQAFDILSSRLYTDTTLAIIRELSTNAADAHVDAGNADRPFDVHLPNAMDPYFSIRDYGTGLSPDDVESIYTTYFESSRNDSDEFTGAMGLGSKSPFAYTDMFSVVSYYDGKKYTYSAFKSESGEPSIALMYEEETDQPNGVEIRIDTKPDDTWAFKEKAQKVYRFFPVKPNITGVRIDFPEYTPVMTGDGWELYNNNSGTNNKISVVMGKVCYAASRSMVTHSLGHMGELVLYVDIGECSVAASREELQYDERTTQNLQKLINEAQEDIDKQINKTIGKCDTIIEQLMARKKFAGLVAIPDSQQTIPTKQDNAYVLRRIDLRGQNKLFIGYDRFASGLQPNIASRYHFVEADVDDPANIKQKLKRNLRHWMKERCNADYSDNKNAIFYLATIEDAKVFEKYFGPASVKLTEIPDAPRNVSKNGSKSGKHTYIKRLRSVRWSNRMADMWESIDTDDVVTIKSIAVRRKGYKVVWAGREIDASEIDKIATLLGFDNVYGLPLNRFTKLRKELGLEDLEEVARKRTEDFVKNLGDFERANFHHGGYCPYNDRFLKTIKDASDTCRNLVTFFNTDNIEPEWKELVSGFNFVVPPAPDYLELFKIAYPLISHIDLHYVRDMSDVLEYIQLKENK